MTGSPHSFSIKHCQILKSNNFSWSVLKTAFHEKKHLIQLSIQTIIQVLFLNTTSILQDAAEVPWAYFPFHHTQYLKDMLKSQDLIKLIFMLPHRAHS